MLRSGRRGWLRSATAALMTVLASELSVYAEVRPVGRVRVTRRSLRETDQGWRVLMTIQLPAPPAEPVQPFTIVLAQSVSFVAPKEGEGREPIRKRIDPPQEHVEHIEVDFRDLSGRPGDRTRAELLLPRARGFSAGEWRMTLRGPQGPVGAPVDLRFEGTNPDDEGARAPRVGSADAGDGSS